MVQQLTKTTSSCVGMNIPYALWYEEAGIPFAVNPLGTSAKGFQSLLYYAILCNTTYASTK